MDDRDTDGARMPDDDALERAALDYLSRYSASRLGVERVLTRRIEKAARRHGTDPEAGRAALRRVLDRLAARGLLDDGRFAEGRARSLLARGRPTVAIRAALRDHGVDAADAARAVAALREEAPQPDLAAALALARRRRLGPYRPADARASRRDKDLAVMARAGFSREIACRVIDAADPEALTRSLAAEEE